MADTRPNARTRPIRLVHCIGTMRRGGAELQLAELICRLPRERFDQSLVLLQGGETLAAGRPLIEKVRAAGCPVLSLHYNMQFHWYDPRSWWAAGRALGRYVAHLIRRRPDIVHAQLYWANIISVLAARLAFVPCVVTSRLQLSPYKAGRPAMQRIENWANRFTDALFVNSEAVRRDVIENERHIPGRIERIYNGVEVVRYQAADPAPLRAELGLSADDFVLVAVANLHPYKGHDDLLRAAAGLLPRHPRLRLVLPGRDQGHGARLRRLTHDLGLDEVVHWLGERQDIPEILALADVVVHPSHEEGFSNAILEAMCAGKPLVVTDVGGNTEAVHHDDNGLVVPPRRPEALAEAVEFLITHPARRQAMGEASLRHVANRFSMERLVENFVRFYESLLK